MLAATNWNEWVGIGTLALAGVTVLLAAVSASGVWVAARSARDTRRLAQTSEKEVVVLSQQVEVQRLEVEAVTRQAEAAQAALRSSARPVLVDVPYGQTGEPAQDYVQIGANNQVGLSPWMLSVELSEQPLPAYYVAVPVRNTGPGIALMVETALRVDPDDEPILGRLTKAVVPPGERTRALFIIPGLQDERRFARAEAAILGNNGSGRRHFLVDYSYGDIDGGQYTRTRFEVASVTPLGTTASWRVLRVLLFSGDDGEPFALSALQ